MSLKLVASTDHLDGVGVPTTGAPFTLFICVNPTLIAEAKYLGLYHAADNNNSFSLGQDSLGGTGKVESLVLQGTPFADYIALSSIPMTLNAWHGVSSVFTPGAAASYLDGGNKGTAAGSALPAGVADIVIGGRITDHNFTINGQAAHAVIFTRALSDLEEQYLGTGGPAAPAATQGNGNPRALKGLSNYWKLSQIVAGKVLDQVGTINLAVTGTSAGASDPNVQTFMVGGPLGNLNFTIGGPIGPINLSAGAGIFDDVASAYTVTLKKIGAPVAATTTTTASSTPSRELIVASAAAFSAGDFASVPSSLEPAVVLAVNLATGHILLDTDQTWAAGATVQHYVPAPFTFPGGSVTANVYSGTATTPTNAALCFFCATCNANAALKAYTNRFTMSAVNAPTALIAHARRRKRRTILTVFKRR